MAHLSALDISLNKSQPGSGSGVNTIRIRNVSDMQMDLKEVGTPGTAATVMDKDVTCHNYGKIGYISHN